MEKKAFFYLCSPDSKHIWENTTMNAETSLLWLYSIDLIDYIEQNIVHIQMWQHSYYHKEFVCSESVNVVWRSWYHGLCMICDITTATKIDIFCRAPRRGLDCEAVYHSLLAIWVTKQRKAASGNFHRRPPKNHKESAQWSSHPEFTILWSNYSRVI